MNHPSGSKKILRDHPSGLRPSGWSLRIFLSPSGMIKSRIPRLPQDNATLPTVHEMDFPSCFPLYQSLSLVSPIDSCVSFSPPTEMGDDAATTHDDNDDGIAHALAFFTRAIWHVVSHSPPLRSFNVLLCFRRDSRCRDIYNNS